MLRHTEKYLNNKKIKYVITREPGGTDVGKKIRSILLSDKNKICDDTELLLMFADRAQHIHSVIQKNLLKGVNVISDRYIYASYAYQGYGRKINKNTIEKLPLTLDIGKHTLLTIKQNLFWAFSYNIIAIPLAILGLLNPMWAALFMAFSDIVVIGNSIRLRYKNIFY